MKPQHPQMGNEHHRNRNGYQGLVRISHSWFIATIVFLASVAAGYALGKMTRKTLHPGIDRPSTTACETLTRYGQENLL